MFPHHYYHTLHLKLLYLLHHSRAQNHRGALLLLWLVVARLPENLLSIFFISVLLLLKELEHLKDVPEKVVQVRLQGHPIQLLKWSVHPSGHEEDAGI